MLTKLTEGMNFSAENLTKGNSYVKTLTPYGSVYTAMT
jgi:hypothetical protein